MKRRKDHNNFDLNSNTSNFYKSNSNLNQQKKDILFNEDDKKLLKYQENFNKALSHIRAIFRKENWNFKSLVDIDPNLGFAMSDMWFLNLEESKLFKKTQFIEDLRAYMKENFLTKNVTFVNIRDISVNNYLSFQNRIQGFIDKIRAESLNLPDEAQAKKFPFVYKELHSIIHKRQNCIQLKDENYSKMLNTLQKLCPSFMSSSQYTSSELDSMVKFLNLAFDDTSKFEVENEKNFCDFEIIEKKLTNLNNLNALHSILFCDIVRQVSLDCAKRGYIMAKIWNFSMSVFKTTIESLSNSMAYISNLYVKERNLLDEFYHKLDNEKSNTVEVYKKEIEELKKKLKETEVNLENMEFSEKKLRIKTRKYKLAFKAIKKELNRNNWERRKVAIRLIVKFYFFKC